MQIMLLFQISCNMQYSSHLFVKAYILILTASSGSCWQFFTTMSDLKTMHSLPDQEHVHSEYSFGHCHDEEYVKIFYTHAHLDHLDILGKIIVRGWIDVIRIPTCIILRATSYNIDMLRSTAYNFQMCVPRITYAHTQQRFKYHYYEWYLPQDMSGGMNWDIYFLGPPNKQWQ